MRLENVRWILFLTISLSGVASSQSLDPSLKSFFEARLLDKKDSKPPSYEELLRVIDTVSAASSESIRSALPVINTATESRITHLPVEAVFAYSAIAQRADAGALLRDSVSQLMRLAASDDERVRNGSAVVLRVLSQSIPNVTIPLMSAVLSDSRYSAGVKSEVLRAILESPYRTDARLIRLIETYVFSSTDPDVQRENLHAITAGRMSSPGMIDFALKSLESRNESLQISAIQALYGMGNEARDKARPLWARIALDSTKTEKVRFLANQAASGTLSQPGKLPEPKSMPRLQGVP